MIGSLGVLSWLQSNVRSLMQKTTAPSYDPDTDSNEALSEAIEQVASDLTAAMQKDTGPSYDADTDSLEAIREKIDTLPTSFTVKSSQSAATATGKITQSSEAGTPPVAAVSAGGSNSWGSWVEVIASLGSDAWISHILINKGGYETNNMDMVVQIGKGSAGSEVSIAQFSFSFLGYGSLGTCLFYPFVIPLPIPIKVTSGSRISCRASSGYSSAIAMKVGVGWYADLET